MSDLHSQFIVYACPVGKLNQQIEKYLHQSRELYKANSAHKYMPHCTLTGFLNAESNSIPVYIEALDKAYIEAKNNLDSDIQIKQLAFTESWHGLELKAENIKTLIANFSQNKTINSYQEKLRLKDWLHLSLAYNFNSEYESELKQLALQIIDLKSDVNWELRFY